MKKHIPSDQAIVQGKHAPSPIALTVACVVLGTVIAARTQAAVEIQLQENYGKLPLSFETKAPSRNNLNNIL